jgi:ribokinase
MDLIVSTERFPASGETVFGSDFHTAPGGKGANQAVQAAKLGADVTMVGKVGDDSFGNTLLESLNSHTVIRNMLKEPLPFPARSETLFWRKRVTQPITELSSFPARI